ncbi:tetratricopeptide repeat protein [Beijerinckia sp. L45]|uniref:tetratricopeptide repeat protein n=1 Tax=Beijerinckia sp. L45 TaxID=1641855 RepID=UPI00131E229E|nr:tetratricopeptide repeat protein [Beijerinckia sp. L45]
MTIQRPDAPDSVSRDHGPADGNTLEPPASALDALVLAGNAHYKQRHYGDAIDAYRAALQGDPRHWSARLNLALALRSTEQYDECFAVLSSLSAEQPHSVFVLNELGKAHFMLQQFTLALDCFERANAIDPKNADSLYWIGGIKHAMGDLVAAERDYARAATVQRLIRRPARQEPPTFSALMLCAPVMANTPIIYLTDRPAYEAHILLLFADTRYDIEELRRSGHIVINLVSDADRGQSLLPVAAELVDALGLPTINHPRQVEQTTRDAIALLLAGLPDVRVPQTLRHRSSDAHADIAPCMAFPLLVRPVGTHGGDDFEKIGDREALEAFIALRPATDHYIIEYLDYVSPDGFFRKYRFIFVGDRVMPYHLAIGESWKVHHAATGMIDVDWMKQEEHAFLQDPTHVFEKRHYAALRAIRDRVGLDFFGIDCGLDRAGNLIVFEVNTSMLVHQNNADFPYKIPFVEAIKTAFDAMLHDRAAGA